MFKIKKQIRGLYLSSILGNLSLTGAWVAILAARGYSLAQIGLAETVFHITSLICEIPSGILADVFGRKTMLIISSIMRMIGNAVMILSCNFPMVALSIAFQALSYNFSSGSGDALAYDSLKKAGISERFEKYGSDQLIIYRLFGGLSTLCVGIALFVGHRIAYGIDIAIVILQILVLLSLHEIRGEERIESGSFAGILEEFRSVIGESISFMKRAKRAMGLMLCNSLVGAVDILLLFFLQARLPEKGMPGWVLGAALLLMETGGIAGSKLILKFPRLRYKTVFVITAGLVLAGLAAEHAAWYPVMVLGGFLSALGDDALQVRTNAVLQDMFPSQQRATLTSLESFSFSMVMIVLSPLAGAFFSVW